MRISYGLSMPPAAVVEIDTTRCDGAIASSIQAPEARPQIGPIYEEVRLWYRQNRTCHGSTRM